MSVCGINDEGKMLSEIGYNVADINVAKWAFCKRFIPEIVQTDDVRSLIEKPVPENAAELIGKTNFHEVLKAVYYRYCKTGKKTSCNLKNRSI